MRIRIKAGPGEDLRGIVEGLAGASWSCFVCSKKVEGRPQIYLAGAGTFHRACAERMIAELRAKLDKAAGR